MKTLEPKGSATLRGAIFWKPEESIVVLFSIDRSCFRKLRSATKTEEQFPVVQRSYSLVIVVNVQPGNFGFANGSVLFSWVQKSCVTKAFSAKGHGSVAFAVCK